MYEQKGHASVPSTTWGGSLVAQVGPLVGVGDVEVGRTELALERWLLVVQAAHAWV